jgi:hypothetical protein
VRPRDLYRSALSLCGLADALDVAVALQEVGKAPPHYLVVVEQNYPRLGNLVGGHRA